MGASESSTRPPPRPQPAIPQNKVVPVSEAQSSGETAEIDAARLRQQLQQEKAEHSRSLKETAEAERKRLDEEAAAQRARLDAEAAEERKRLYEIAVKEVEEVARVRNLAAEERKRLDEEAAAQRRRLDEEAAAQRRRLDEEAAAQRRRLDGEAADERSRLLVILKQALQDVSAGAVQSTLSQPVRHEPAAQEVGDGQMLTQPSRVSESLKGPQQAAVDVPQQPKETASPERREPQPQPKPDATSAAGLERQEAVAAEALQREDPKAAEREKQEMLAAAIAAAHMRTAEAEAAERNWTEEDLLVRILKHGATLEELPESILDLHDGMPAALRDAPMRLLKLDAVLGWSNVKVYEEVDRQSECLEVPYGAVDNAMWNSTIILSWRWSFVKPAEHVPGFSPMSAVQFAELTAVMKRAWAEGVKYIWIDWACVPQYSASPMVEVLRSKVFYARARAMTVIPTFHSIPTDGIVRLLLVKAGRVTKRRAATSLHSAIVAARLDSILSKDQVAGRDYFSRVWTLAERMARFGRPEQLCNWLSLEAWLGMLVDAMLKSTDDHSASEIYKRILGREAGMLLDAVLEPLGAAVRTGSMHVADGLEESVAELFEIATGIWHTSQELGEAPTKGWLMSYLLEAHSGIYQAWSNADRIWSVYSYFCWKQLDQRSEAGLMEALQDLVRVAGGGRKQLMCMATKLGLAKMLPPADVDRQLVAAATKDDGHGVLDALEAGASPDALGEEGATPLILAAKAGNVEVMRALLRAGADLNITTVDGSTALYTACAAGQLEAAKVLVKAGANLETKKQQGISALHIAADWGYDDIVRLLLDAGAAKDPLTEESRTPLYLAAMRGRTGTLRILIDAGADKNFQRPNGWTPLGAAAAEGHLEAVQVLLHAGAIKEPLCTDSKRTPLHVAADEGHAPVVKALLQAGLNKEAYSSTKTPLHMAASSGKLEAAKALLDGGANIEARTTDDDRRTPLMVAALANSVDVLKLLLERSAQMEAEDKGGWTALHYAANGDSYECVRALKAAGADLRAKTNNGNLPRDVTTNKMIKELLPGKVISLF